MFWDRVSGVYDLYQLLNRKANNGVTAICASYLSKDDIVLECACGTGIMTKGMAPHCRKLIATDFSRKMLAQAKRKLREQENVRFCYADIMNLEFADARFDKAVAANVIHLLNEPEKALRELMRVVKPGGTILIPTYISKEANSSARITKIFNKIGANFRNEFDIDSYRKFFESMGIQAQYRLAPGLISCCVAVIQV